MRETFTRMEITPRIIDLGERIIQLSSVASVGIGAVHPLRPAAKIAFAIGGITLLVETVRNGSSGSGGSIFSPIAILALIALAVAAALYFYRINLLIISTSDSLPTWIRSTDPTFLRLILENIRTAMQGGDPDFRVVVDLAGQSIGTGQADPADVQGTPGPLVADATAPASWADRGPEPQLPNTNPGTSRPAEARPATGALVAEPRSGFAEALFRETRGSDPVNGHGAPLQAPARSNGRAEVEQVIRLIDGASLPHKAELRALLDPVLDHVASGRTSRRDARHNWQLFHDYAQKYLTDVAGLAESCRRVEASLQ